MIFDILGSILAALLSMIVVPIYSELLWKKVIRRVFKKEEPEETYSDKLKRLMESLLKSSSEVDNVLFELSQTAIDKEKSVLTLETELRDLESREKQLKEMVTSLEKVSIPVAEHFARLTADGERRSAKRDYFLFGAGVIVSTFITILLQIFL